MSHKPTGQLRCWWLYTFAVLGTAAVALYGSDFIQQAEGVVQVLACAPAYMVCAWHVSTTSGRICITAEGREIVLALQGWVFPLPWL
jgi:hypothetical protein